MRLRVPLFNRTDQYLICIAPIVKSYGLILKNVHVRLVIRQTLTAEARSFTLAFMFDGFYSANFELVDEDEGGGGVILLLNGQLYGGDTSYSYQGTYRVEDTLLTISMHVFSFNAFSRSIFSAFEDTDDEIKLSGQFQEGGFLLKGQLNGIEDKITVTGKKLTPINP